MKSLQLFLIVLTIISILPYCLLAEDSSNNAKCIIEKHRITFNNPPQGIPSAVSVDAPLLGYGFTGVAISGAPEKQVYYLARNDFWRLKLSFNQSFPAVLGKLNIEIPELKDASYKVEQDLYSAQTFSKFTQTGKELNAKRAKLITSAIQDFQPEKEWELGGEITVEARKGWLIYIENW